MFAEAALRIGDQRTMSGLTSRRMQRVAPFIPDSRGLSPLSPPATSATNRDKRDKSRGHWCGRPPEGAILQRPRPTRRSGVGCSSNPQFARVSPLSPGGVYTPDSRGLSPLSPPATSATNRDKRDKSRGHWCGRPPEGAIQRDKI